MFDKAVNTYPFTIQLVSECYKIQKMCEKAVNRCFMYLILFLIDIKLKESVIYKDPIMVIYCPDRYKI